MRDRRTWLGAGAAVVVAVLGYLAWDALVETDEERLEGFVADVTGPVAAARVDAARARWVDLDRQPFEVSALGESLYFRAGEDAALGERAARATRELAGADLRALTRAIVVEGDAARVTLRLLSRERGMMQVEWRLRRHGQDWLVERLAVTR
ncbi:MAG: hypothetical protein KF729_37870 [Sandaracinaceae bacterium]|nr:hypothetical protein [Sandaracinaceae bacterium]